eukprot:438812_1
MVMTLFKILYDDIYKHGFAVDLYDPFFNKLYKQLTKYEHISVNYDRNAVFNDEKRAEYAYDEKKNKICKPSQVLDLQECPFINYVTESLSAFRTMKLGPLLGKEMHHSQFDLQYLSECQDHIIAVHSFCLIFSMQDKRLQIKHYFNKIVD